MVVGAGLPTGVSEIFFGFFEIEPGSVWRFFGVGAAWKVEPAAGLGFVAGAFPDDGFGIDGESEGAADFGIDEKIASQIPGNEGLVAGDVINEPDLILVAFHPKLLAGIGLHDVDSSQPHSEKAFLPIVHHAVNDALLLWGAAKVAGVSG